MNVYVVLINGRILGIFVDKDKAKSFARDVTEWDEGHARVQRWSVT